MEKLQVFIKKYTHPLTMALIFVLSAAVMGWVAIDVLPDAAEKGMRTIVNDDYSLLTEEITDGDGIRQTIQVKGGSRLYGLSMNFHIFNRVQHGRVFVDLLDSRGQVIASASDDMTTILDNTFKGFIFDREIRPDRDSRYTIHLYIQPETAEDRIALWKSRGDYEGFGLMENGKKTTGALALQYTTAHVGGDIYGFYAIISALVIVGLQLLYFMIFVKKCKTETAFRAAALIMGLVFALFTPVAGGPDEYVHIATSYKISNKIMGVPSPEKGGRLYIRECDNVIPLDATVEYNAFSFQQMYEGLYTGTEGKTDLVEVKGRDTGVFRPAYLPQALGITVARLLNLGFVPLILMGRIFALLFYIAAVYFAVKIMPVFKTTLALCALLPMSMQLAANFCYDNFILATAFLFTALVFDLAYTKEKISVKNLILPTAVLCLLTPVKPIYIVMALLVFIIPNGKFKDKKFALAAKTAMMAVGVVLWMVINMGSVIGTLKPKETKPAAPKKETVQTTRQTPREVEEIGLQYPYDLFIRANPPREQEIFWDPESDLLPNGDSRYYYSVSYILTHLRQTIKLVMNTITTHSGKYLRTMIGTRLGEIIVVDLTASWIWFCLIVMVLLLSVLDVNGRQPAHKGLAKWLGAFIFIGVMGLSVAACIMWTPINYTTVFGVQGRYFLPAFPLMVMFFSNKIVTLTKKIDDILIYSIVPLNIFVVLNVFMMMCK